MVYVAQVQHYICTIQGKIMLKVVCPSGCKHTETLLMFLHTKYFRFTKLYTYDKYTTASIHINEFHSLQKAISEAHINAYNSFLRSAQHLQISVDHQ